VTALLYLLYPLGLIGIALTLGSLSKHEAWWIRACDFPRLQIVLLLAAVLTLLVATADLSALANQLLAAALVLCLGGQLAVVLPYTPLWPVELLPARNAPDECALSLLIVNVLMTNRAAEGLLASIRTHAPDVVLALEVDDWWHRRLAGLADDYPHRLVHPLDNTYGMLCYSKLELIEPELRFLLKPGIPSLRAGLRLRSGERVTLYGLHPEPPAPDEADTSLPRDAELVLIARELAAAEEPAIVAGDLNDVAWSHTSRLFRRLSRMLDPRIGRGMFNSFHARYWFLRWPLDHVFVSDDFLLHALHRLPAFGSDHFPILISVAYAQRAAAAQEAPEPDAGDQAEADDKLERAESDPAPTA
jgi:endonuclease/exonuclease/phosphatase (EEP) superfamily protein YafD